MKPTPVKPQPGQESVWDYPRPPRLEPVQARIQIISGGLTLADTSAAYRVLETSHPPTYYLPPSDLRLDLLEATSGSSTCEWKGAARYWALRSTGLEVAWSYPNPNRGFEPIRDYLAFYADRVVLGDGDGCFVNNERVRAQPGEFYGGWITGGVVGPFKGEPGSWGW